jgi:DNA gyrase/topoisomerase IV subunit A
VVGSQVAQRVDVSSTALRIPIVILLLRLESRGSIDQTFTSSTEPLHGFFERAGYGLDARVDHGAVIRMRADEIQRYGRATQGVRVMNMREGDVVSASARMVVSESGATDEEIDADQPT